MTTKKIKFTSNESGVLVELVETYDSSESVIKIVEKIDNYNGVPVPLSKVERDKLFKLVVFGMEDWIAKKYKVSKSKLMGKLK